MATSEAERREHTTQRKREAQRAQQPAKKPAAKKKAAPKPDAGQKFLQWAHSAGVTGEQLFAAAANDKYPELSWMLTDPEAGPILRDLIAGNIDDTTFKNRLMATNFYRTHSESMRQWDTLAFADPATAQARIRAHTAEITDLASQMGVRDPGQIYSWSVRSLRFGWSDAELRDKIANAAFATRKRTGGAASAFQSVEQMTHDFAVPLSNHTQRNMARRYLSGEIDEAGLRAFFVQRAKSMYAGNADITDALDAGQTVREYADPYVELAARELEVNPATINILEPKWHRALQTVSKDGRRAPLSMADWQAKLRTDPIYGWDTTHGARQQAAADALKIDEMFGAA